MFLGEPPPSPADLHFRLLGFPVRVHPYFWVVTLLLGMGGGPAEPVSVLAWVVVVFVSILVHELGHALVQRYYGGRPWITLYSFGGLASCNDCDRSPKSQIVISLAGPMAGFLLAVLLLAAVLLAGHWVVFILFGNKIVLSPSGSSWMVLPTFHLFAAGVEQFESRFLDLIVHYMLYVNILWGLVNLLPVYPLDGGHVARELFTLGNPRRGIVLSLQLSIGAAILVAVYALSQKSLFTCIMFALLAHGSYQALRAYQAHWR